MVDYSVANRVTDNVALTVDWAYAHDLPMVAKQAMWLLSTLDSFGSSLITIVLWIVNHTS